MRLRILFLSLMLASGLLRAATNPPVVQEGKSATVLVLGISRLEPASADDAPDGVVMMFLVRRRDGVSGQIALPNETRDATVDAKSYVELTREALGKTFEPSTVVDAPAKFFARHTELAPPANAKLNNALVVSVALRGAALKPGQTVQAVLHVGFGDDAGDFAFTFAVPAAARR